MKIKFLIAAEEHLDAIYQMIPVSVLIVFILMHSLIRYNL
jgi:hypothetical protein